MIAAQALAALPLAALLLVGCAGTDPVAERREVVATLTEAANTGDAGGVRRHADRLVELVRQQLAGEQVDAAEAERLTALADSVRRGADAIDVELQQRLKAEADAEAARKELEQTQRRLEEERRKAEEAARQAEQAEQEKGEGEGEGEKGEGKGDGKGKGDDKDDD